jgi:hypothetical protein
LKKYEESEVHSIKKLIQVVDEIMEILDKISEYIENKGNDDSIDTKEEVKEIALTLNSDKAIPRRDAKGRCLDESTLGYLLLLNCGHNGVLKIGELSQYEAHLIAAGIIEE